MNTYISILRGINVSGQKLIKMDALKKMYQILGLENIQTYIQSGNVIFQHASSETKDLETMISKQIEVEFGFDVPVMVLSIEHLSKIVSDNPYTSDHTKDISHLHVTFLSSPVQSVDLKSIKEKQAEGEDFTITEHAIYLYCPHGYGKTKLTNNFFENKLKVSTTTRNWKTTKELLSIAQKVQNL